MAEQEAPKLTSSHKHTKSTNAHRGTLSENDLKTNRMALL